MTERQRGVSADGRDFRAGGLEINGLSHDFAGVPVLRDVNLRIAPGEVHCLVGPSGCGKSTTLRLIAGLLPLQQGRIGLDGRVLSEPGRLVACEKRRVGLMFQDLALFPHLDVFANVAFGMRKRPAGERRERTMALLEMLDIARYAGKHPGELSGGEQQRVALARALAPEPGLMLLDEPFSALDTALRADVRSEILARLREAGVPTLLVTHDPEEAISSSDVVHIMQKGRIVQSGTPENLYAMPQNEFVARFFGNVVRFGAPVRGGRAVTPLGEVAVPDLADDTQVNVIFRTDSIGFEPEYEGTAAAGRVIDCRNLGPACNVAIKLERGPIMTVRVPSHIRHDVGMRVGFKLDPRHVFVFEQSPPQA